MAAETTGDVSLIQDEDILRKMWQDTEDFGKKKEIRSHMYKIREARLKDFYNTGEEITSSSENKQHSSSSTIRTTSHSTTTGLKGSDLTTHADSLADHSFLSLKSKEIRDSESPTKDSYKIIPETKKLNDRDWNVVESNEASKDGKTHTTSRLATTSGKQDIEGGEMKYAAKSEQKASVFKDGDDKNFTKAVQASSQNVIKQEAAGGDDNSKFYTSSTTTTSSSKFSSEQRSSSDDVKSNMQGFEEQQPTSKNTRTIVRKVYTEDIPKINDPNTKVTTETHTLPDGSTVTTTRYETKGSTQYKTSSSSASTSTKQVSSSSEQKATSDVVKSHSITTDDLNRDYNDRTTHSDSISSRKEIHRDESDIRRIQDLELLGRDTRNVKNVEIIVKNQTIPQEQTRTVTSTTHTEYDRQIPIKDGSTTITTTKTFTIPADQQETRSSSTTTTKKIISSNYDKQQVASTDFLDSERHHVAQTKTKTTTTIDDQPLPTRKEITETVPAVQQIKPVTTYPKVSETIEIEIIPITKDELKYEQPERRQPIKPHKGELDERPTPTEGQYDTTYRSDYVPRKISVEVSPTHDAFARSLRSISPDRISKTGSVRSLRTTSTTSLRSSPDRYPNRASRVSPSDSTRKVKGPGYPEVTPNKKRMSESPEKRPQKHEDKNTDTITRKKKTTTTTIDNKTETDSSTLTRKHRPVEKPRSRSVSPTSIASDIEFIRHRTDLVTDLDVDETTKLQRRHTEEFDKLPLTDATTPKKSQKITNKSATLPLPAKSPTKETPQSNQPERTKPKTIRRTDTYEERCKEILGIGEVSKKSPQKSPEKDSPHQDKPKVVKKTSSVQEFPSQVRKSPQKEPLEPYPVKPKDDKSSPSVQEFPSQIRKSPQKEALGPYPEKPKGDKKAPSVQEFPSQTRKSPRKEPLEPYPEKPKAEKKPSSVQEFPSHIRKSPQKEPLEPYPEKPRADKKPSSVQEFPSQIKKSPQREPLEPYPEKPKGDKKAPSVQEFPSQIRKSPQKEPLEPYPEKPKGDKRTPSVQEFPSQIRKSPQKEPLEPYPEKPKDDKRAPSIQEFPSQVKKTPQKEPLEPYPEKLKGDKKPSSIQEFPSQIKKSPQKEPLEPYPDKPRDDKKPSSVQEFPSQIRKSPQKEPLEPYPEKPKSDKKAPSIQEFPSQIKRSPEIEPLEPYPEKPRDNKKSPSVQEFPSQVRKSPQKEPLEPYPEKPKDDKKPSSVQEFPSQIRKLPQKEPLEPYPEKPSDDRTIPERPTESITPISKPSPEEPFEHMETLNYPRYYSDDHDSDFDHPLQKGPTKVSLDDLPTIKTDKVSLDDLTTITVTKKPFKEIPEKVSLGDLHPKKSQKLVDNFITKEKIDTEVTLKKYKDDSIHRPKGIPSDTKTKKKPKKITGSESSTSEDEDLDDIEDQIIIDETDDVNLTVTRVTTTESQQLKSPKKEGITPQKKVSPTNKRRPKSKPDVEDFITVTKAQLQEGESRIPVEEVVQPKRIVRELCKKETPSKTPDVKKKDTTIKSKRVISKEPAITNKQPIRKIQDNHHVIKSEYTDQYTTKINDKRVSKPITSKTPVKQPEARKPNQETTLHFKVQKIDSTTTSSTTKRGVNVTKVVQIDKKPTAKIPLTYTKKPTDQQPKPKSKIIEPTRSTIPSTKLIITAPTKRHVVSTIINLKPKHKPETVTKTIHKTTATKTIIAPTKSTRSTPQKVTKSSKLKPSLNGDISTEEDDSDVENITVKTSKNQVGSLKTEKKKKCITTKSILIENAVADQREIIVDLKRSKSSREGTPDQICPYPVSTESDLGTPRYPDRVTEPEDGQRRLKPKRISDIPLDETKDVHDFERVTEIKTDVEDTDECLLSVNEKVTKFLSTAEQITKKSVDSKPAPKVERPSLEVDESLKEDECLLSVSDKVNKFIATAEQLSSSTTKETITNKTQKYKDDEVIETNRQLTPKSRTPETDSSRFKTPTDSYTRRPTQDLAEVRKQPIEDDTTPKTSRRLSKDDAKPAMSPTGRLRSTETIKKAKALFENFGSDHEVTRQKDILTRPSVFEVRKVKQSEVEKKDVRTKLIYDEHQLRRSPSPQHKLAKPKTTRDLSPEGETPHYMLPLDRNIKEHHKSPKENPDDDLGVTEVDRSRGTTPDRNVPHYMLPLDRSLRERSPHKDNVKQLEDIMNRSVTTTYSDDMDVKTTTTKFGVTLRRTDSGRMVQSTSRKLSTSSVDEKLTDVDVEEIFDLEYLEKLLEIIVGYDIRRRIRAQIRLIKRAIEDNTLETLIITRRRSPIKETTRIEKQEVSEYQRKSSASEFSTKTKSPSPVRNQREPSPKKPQDRKSKTPESDVVRTTTTTTTKIFQTDLKKPKPVTKTITEDKPEWVTQRTLRKVSETTPIKKTVTSTTTTTTHKSSTRKDGGISKQPTDDITSSYGVGPTDENGTPLFGLKALRAQNKSEKTKVQGTVIRSQFYSENGEEPEGEISVTKFSTDPKDLGHENIVEDRGVASVTTTQKFGYKGTPALKSIANKSKKTSNEETEYKTSSVKVSKIARKGSVKEISQKFLDNAVESLKSERQSSYPKAGLILRTSSFKDSPSNGMELDRSREGSPATQEIHEKVVTRVETTSTTSGGRKSDTFLSNKSKVTDVQDVISRMKNEAEIEVEETEEDAEARNLLNKFIGSQVLLSGMESQLSKSTGSDTTTPAGSVNKRTTKITTTTTSSDSSKPTNVTCTFTHPITVELLQNIWDEQTLKLLLEQSTDYEDRRIIRTRLREVMAEQEACAELVEKATSEDTSISKETGNTVHGESLLLPLLQGLLDQPENDQPADSGTESGEDLRSGLIVEVQTALDKLANSLKSPSTNITEERRDSLLQLVNRLQAGLSTSQLSNSSTSSSVSSSERRSSLQGRFSKRKQRANRHTVGVSSEELEDARRLMEEIAFHGNLNPSGLQKQNSEGSVLETPPFKPLSKIKPVRNVTAKPFFNTNAVNQTIDTPSETSGSLEFLVAKEHSHPQFQHSLSLDTPQIHNKQKRPQLTETMSLDCTNRDNPTTVDLISIQKAVTQAAAIKQLSQMKFDVSDGVTNRADDSESDEETEDEDDDDQATVKTALQNEIRSPPQQQPQPDLIMQTNPLYNRPSEERDTTNNNSENDDYPTQLNEKANRFNSKKLKMKRANTIDIPKPLNYYEDDDDDSDNENLNNRRNSYLALRGPIRVGKLNVEKKVPEFEPKTESDKKFMAFLGKHTENSINTNKTSLWCNQQSAKNSNNSNWTNKFGNIKNNFEKIQTSNSVNSARNFWKSADDAVMAGRAPQFGPKISRQSAKNLQQMFEEKQKQNQNQSNVVTGHLKVDTSKTSKNVTVVTQPNAINKFSHAPMSAFKPVAKKLEFPQHQPQPQQNHQQQNQPQYSSYIKPKPLRIAPPTINNNTNLQATDNKNTIKPPDSPLYLYSPKQVSPQTTSPTNSAPWNPGKNSAETAPPCSRVLSIAAAKFQNMNQERDLPPRKMSKEKIVIPPSLLSQQTQPQDKLTSPYIVKNAAQGSTVRKLSGQYDSLGNRDVYNPPVNKIYKQKAPLYSDHKQQYVGKTTINSDNQSKTMAYNDTTRSSDTRQHYNTNATLYSDYVGKTAAINSDNKAKASTYNDTTRSSDTRQHYNTNATLYSDYVEKTAINSDNKAKTSTYNDTTRSSDTRQHYNTNATLYSDYAGKTAINSNNQATTTRSSDDKQYYSSSTRSSDDYGYTRRSSIDKKDYRDVRRSSESDKQHYGDVRRSSESDKHHVNVIPRSSDHKDQYYPQTPPGNKDMQQFYESSSRLSSDDHQHDNRKPITLSSDDDRRIYQTNVVVSDPSSDAHDNNLYSDDAPECDAPPRLFVPGENYTIQYDSLPHTPVYSAEYAVSQQSYDSPQIEVKPEEDIDYHNRQQLMISRIQQVSPNVREDDESHQYTSNYNFRPQMSPKVGKREVDREETEDLFSNETKSPYSKESFKYERQTSQESVKEYTAVSSKVMSGPVSQQAVTVQQNKPRNRDQHDMEYNLKTTLQKLSSYSDKQAATKPVLERKSSLKQISSEPPPPLVVYNNVTQRPSLCINDKPLSLELLDVNEKGEQVLTSKFHIPIRRQSENLTTGQSSGGHELSKSESWHQICQNQQTPKKPSPRASPNTRSVLRSKSSHSLAVPKQFEAGMSKTEMLEKKKTMEAYFGAPPAKIKDSKKVQSSINRVKTSQKVSTQRQISSGGNTGGLCRSKTLPDIVCLDKLDDTSIDAIFEDLFNSRSTTRTTTYTQGPVTTTSQVTTTRVTSQEPMKKPMSPFAKFRQLDKQNSLNSPPSTPKSPTAGGPLFKFTDPSLTQSANTVKQRLLQWCQMKTKEYENIQLDNFSTSWSDGMAFCALIHHFLPDTFDYNTLNPKNRRHNFTLAFRVAEEKAGIAPLLDVDDMVAIRKPDWKCVFTYVQSIYRRFKDDD